MGLDLSRNQKPFIRDRVWRGRSKPGCRIGGSVTPQMPTTSPVSTGNKEDQVREVTLCLWDISGKYPLCWFMCHKIPGKAVRTSRGESVTVPEEWCRGIFVPIYKGKGSRSEGKNYRGITLLSVPGKMFMHVVLSRIKPTLLACRGQEQIGFIHSFPTVHPLTES